MFYNVVLYFYKNNLQYTGTNSKHSLIDNPDQTVAKISSNEGNIWKNLLKENYILVVGSLCLK